MFDDLKLIYIGGPLDGTKVEWSRIIFNEFEIVEIIYYFNNKDYYYLSKEIYLDSIDELTVFYTKTIHSKSSVQ